MKGSVSLKNSKNALFDVAAFVANQKNAHNFFLLKSWLNPAFHDCRGFGAEEGLVSLKS
jgi:hypothetical protein